MFLAEILCICHIRGARVAHPGLGSNPKTTPLFMSVEFVFGFVGFSPGTPVFPSPQKPTLPNSNSIWNAGAHLSAFKCFVANFIFCTIYIQFKI